MPGDCWLILGASSSIARAFARAVAERGDRVLLAGRDQDDLARTAADLGIRYGVECEILEFDALAFDRHADFAALVEARAFGSLNVFLAFGTMVDQSQIDRSPSLARLVLDTNLGGAISILSHLAPVMEAQGKGRIVVIGSVAGDRGRRGNHVYGAAKAGLHAYCQGLRARLFRSGVTLTTIKPGFVDTSMTWGLPGLFLVASPAACARACLRHADRGAGVRYVPAFWWGIMTTIRLIPEPLFKRLSI